MRFGVNTFLWTATFTDRNFDLLPTIRDHGFDGIEVSLFHPQEFLATKIRHALSEYGLGCTVCSVLPNGMSLICDDSDIRRKARSHMSDCVLAARGARKQQARNVGARN
jgi:D-psicose/D-tagatose/L-ribulose 3-epimerase